MGISPLICAAEFDPKRDTPGFANETVFAYDGRPQELKAEGERYKRRCFVMVKSILQFHRFAEFQAKAPKLTEADLEARIRRICRTPPWKKLDEPVLIPGYADLRELSLEKGALLRNEMGAWLPTYFRAGNTRIMMPVLPGSAERCAEWLRERVAAGEPQGVFIAKLPRMIHAVVLHQVKVEPDGTLVFTAYDPNLLDSPRKLRFHPKRGVFEYEPTFYFKGGTVNTQRIYLSPIQ